MTAAEKLLANNRAYAATFNLGGLPVEPARRVAVVACMDSRMDLFGMLGLKLGEAHIIRNAGGVVTEDVIRSLIISQRFMDTKEIVIVMHTDCGMVRFRDNILRWQLAQETGVRPPFTMESFRNPYDEARQSVARLKNSPFILHKEHIRAFVFNVKTGRLAEVQDQVHQV